MSLNTYTALQAAVAAWLNRTDMAGVIPDLIALAEAELGRDPAIEDERFATVTLATQTVDLPTEVREVTDLFYNDTAARFTIEVTSPENVARQTPWLTATGRPRYAALINNATQLLLSPTPDQAYTAYMQYAAALTPLATAVNGTNWLLTSHPDIYLFATLMQSAPYLKDDARIAVWSAGLDRAKASLADLTKRRKYSANTPIARPRRVIG